MRLHLLAVGARRPAWEVSGYREYARRLPRECALNLVEIPTAPRRRSRPVERLVAEESARLLAAVPPRARVVALDQRGEGWSTEGLAHELRRWLSDGLDVALLAGGPDGLAPAALTRAERRWSLSPLTLPHGLVRVLVAEQIYRAWSLLNRHPYHRG